MNLNSLNIQIKVNKDSKVVIATARTNFEGIPLKLKATATCSPEDSFDEEFGIRLAKAKLYKKYLSKLNSIINQLKQLLTSQLDALQKIEVKVSQALYHYDNKINYLINYHENERY